VLSLIYLVGGPPCGSAARPPRPLPVRSCTAVTAVENSCVLMRAVFSGLSFVSYFVRSLPQRTAGHKSTIILFFARTLLIPRTTSEVHLFGLGTVA